MTDKIECIIALIWLVNDFLSLADIAIALTFEPPDMGGFSMFGRLTRHSP
ncbi:hypothetical protein COO91_03497 [Nostoc flagelliforme CCNUN1]|uniref:Uncharacterized protein n=1 Tax=Nostoc flagelliforme CCNUN1 TaxID=2038116 RepID=A0A2K8SQ16_9NOSO|nr:hypothetical protein [Nostoc flagelliforme]AUB37552.1 hypothetical protein COO91_03497 [Nostoc flagelliforme CCNUN1]